MTNINEKFQTRDDSSLFESPPSSPGGPGHKVVDTRDQVSEATTGANQASRAQVSGYGGDVEMDPWRDQTLTHHDKEREEVDKMLVVEDDHQMQVVEHENWEDEMPPFDLDDQEDETPPIEPLKRGKQVIREDEFEQGDQVDEPQHEEQVNQLPGAWVSLLLSYDAFPFSNASVRKSTMAKKGRHRRLFGYGQPILL